MGEAKRRGSFEERKAEAIKAGRSLVKVRLLRNNEKPRARFSAYKAMVMANMLANQGRSL